MGCINSLANFKRLTTFTFSRDLGDEVALTAMNIPTTMSSTYNWEDDVFDPNLYNTTIKLKKSSNLYPRLMEDMKDKSNIFIVFTKPRREVDDNGKLRNGLYLIYYKVANENPVNVNVITSAKRGKYYDVILAKDGVAGMIDPCRSFSYISPGIHEVRWRIDSQENIIIEKI